MKGFTLILQDATRTERVEGVTSFIGEDTSGSFGILAGHARIMSALVMGLARFRRGAEAWQYLAVPGALLYFRDGRLIISTRHYLRDADYSRISALLQEQLAAEETRLQSVKQSLRQMETELLRRMWEIGRA